MPSYVYRCPDGHLTEHVQSIHDALPHTIPCECSSDARRVFLPPAAIHFHGGGFYSTDVKGRYDRRRRKNPGDTLPLPMEAAITKAEGAEIERPRNLPDTISRAA